MNNIKIILNYTSMKIKSFFFSQKGLILAVYIVALILISFKGMRNLCADLGYNISIFSYPCFIATPNLRPLILIGSGLMFLDAPFLNNLSLTFISKMKKKMWIISNSFYIFVMSIIYTLILNLSIIVILIGSQSITKDWGKVIYTLSRNPSLLREYGFKIIYSYEIVGRYTPFEAMGHSILLSIVQFTIIGLIIMCISLFFKTNIFGIIAAAAYIFSENYLGILGDSNYTKLIPVIYLDIGKFEQGSFHWTIPIEKAYIVLMTIVFILIILAYFRMKNTDINLYKELE